jgi:hypothetical protein
MRKKNPAELDAVQQVTVATTEERNWFTAPASATWTGRKIRHKKTQKEYAIGDVFGEMHVEIEKDAKTTIHSAALLRQRYDPVLSRKLGMERAEGIKPPSASCGKPAALTLIAEQRKRIP